MPIPCKPLFAWTLPCVLIVLSGCGGSGTSANSAPPTSSTPPALAGGCAATVYVVQTASVTQGSNSSANDSVLGFPAGANGTQSPSVQYNSGGNIGAIAMDASGQMYMGFSVGASAIRVFPAPFTANAVASRRLCLNRQLVGLRLRGRRSAPPPIFAQILQDKEDGGGPWPRNECTNFGAASF